MEAYTKCINFQQEIHIKDVHFEAVSYDIDLGIVNIFVFWSLWLL